MANYPEVDPNPNFPDVEQQVLKYWQENNIFTRSVEERPTTIEDTRSEASRPSEPSACDPLRRSVSEARAAPHGRAVGEPGSNINNEFIFYDGPPFANGLPHYGHLLTGYVKDAIARYQTMKGKRTERRFGWDCHGLPAEMGAEKELGISGRQAIQEYGIQKFNEYCRTSVMKYTSEWEYYVNRQARWVDFKNDYKTMDKDFMESVLWAFKQLYDKGLVYEAYRVMPYSWAAETPLSNFETKLDNSYREREDKAITVAFELCPPPDASHLPPPASGGGVGGGIWNKLPKADKYYILAWTTTPWTLPSNLALAVGEKVEYVAITSSPLGGEHARSSAQHEDQAVGSKETTHTPPNSAATKGLASSAPPQGGGETTCYILAKNALPKYTKELGVDEENSELSTLNSELLIGLTYKPLFPYFADHPNSFSILDGSDFVTDTDGTGIVHMAPGFGEDDQRICEKNGIELVVPVDGQGKFTDEIFDIPAAPKPTRSKNGIYETERCILRPFTEEDADLLIALHTNKTVMDTVNDGLQTAEEARADLATFIAHQQQYGFGQWAVFHKESGEFMGRAGIQMMNQRTDGGDEKPVLRAALTPEFWGNGYGTELCRFCTALGLHTFGLEEIVAGAVEHNPRAIHMLERLGYEQRDWVKYKHHMGPYCVVTKDTFEQAHVPLKLAGLNVIAQTEGQCEDEPYKPEQLKKYGLANLRIINWLKMRGLLIKQEDFKHNYPHCWRTDTPLIYRALPSWYVAVTKFKDRAVELNQQINWIPSHIRDGQMGHMLETAPDWSISRNRFWGTPIPVWKGDKGGIKVFGSIEELEAFFFPSPSGRGIKGEGKSTRNKSLHPNPLPEGEGVTDLHRPYIDELIKTDEHGETWQRVEDVFDCWFESGSMPFAQVHYPFENKEWFESHFPADFITEYVGQTRGWFNTLIVLSTALFDKPPFKNCICHGVVLDSETGMKYSKRLKNYKDPKEVMDQYGADALRWLMLASPVMRGLDMSVDPEGKFIRDVVRLAIKPIWNAYNFFVMYANADNIRAIDGQTGSEHLMDRYILAKCDAAVQQIEQSLDAYDTPGACEAVIQFFEVLNNWYIRRSKERFWKEEKDADKQAAYDTLYHVIATMCQAAAPLLPFTLEYIYTGLTGEESVHLADFPSLQGAVGDEAIQTGSLRSARDDDLIQQMDLAQDICNAALAVRSKLNIRVRQPLTSLTIVSRTPIDLGLLGDIIEDEVNVKTIETSTDFDRVATLKLRVNSKILGKRLPEKMKQVLPASKKGEWKKLENGNIEVAGVELLTGEFDILLEPSKEYADNAQALSSNDALVILDTNVTPELEKEGFARDLVRMIQQARKDAGLNISDRIELAIDGDDALVDAAKAYQHYITEQTLTQQLINEIENNDWYKVEQSVDNKPITIALRKVA